MILSAQQNHALKLITEFCLCKNKSVFILRGYAGTGKTTLIKEITEKATQLGKQVTLMAPTGRAAKVLKEKTGNQATTIHRGIYSFTAMKSVRYDELGTLLTPPHTIHDTVKSKESESLQFWFDIQKHPSEYIPSRQLFIIDESSMISSRPMTNEQLHFGTDVLLNDLLTYIQPHAGGKVLFIGDPAQLPPVGDNYSAALDSAYFENKQLAVSSYELTDVVRQNEGSAILGNAMKVRDLLHEDFQSRNKLCFERKEAEVMDMDSEEVVESFFASNPYPQLGDSVILCYTNASTKEYNDALRNRYFPNHPEVVVGDILQIVRNRVLRNPNFSCFNGDFVRVLEASPQVETLSAPVWTEVGGQREKVTISLDFRDVLLQFDEGTQMRCKLIDSLLNSRNPVLTPLETTALYINFRIRHPRLKPQEESFKETLMSDPYFNAIQAKYGYAITGHKSQGGEWKTVYVDYQGRLGFNDDCLRWIYTSTTRASKTLYGVQMPNITPMTSLIFNPIVKISKPQKEAFSYANVADSPFLPISATSAQKQKALWVKQQLDEAGFFLKAIQPCQYNDKYVIEVPSGSVTWDCYYNASGLYTRYVPNASRSENEVIRSIMENESGMQYSIDYQPSSESFLQLYFKMKSACDNFDIHITNIVEHPEQFYVSYYLKTSGKFASVQFYFKKNFALTHALPFSELGTDDEKLKELVEYLK